MLALDIGNKIKAISAEDYPELYKKKNMFDGVHFDNSGAEAFSKVLAQEFVKVVGSEPKNQKSGKGNRGKNKKGGESDW